MGLELVFGLNLKIQEFAKKCQSLSCNFRHLKKLNSNPHPKNLPKLFKMLKLGLKVLLKSDNHLTWVPMLMDWGIRTTFRSWNKMICIVILDLVTTIRV
jgi:hypothetical protein